MGQFGWRTGIERGVGKEKIGTAYSAGETGTENELGVLDYIKLDLVRVEISFAATHLASFPGYRYVV